MDLESLVVRMVGDDSSYQQMIKRTQEAMNTASTISHKANLIERLRIQTETRRKAQLTEINGLLKQGTLTQEQYNKARLNVDPVYRKEQEEAQKAKQRQLEEEARNKRMWQDRQRNAATAIYATGQVVSAGTALMTERFQTTGEAMSNLGTIVQAIPVPFAQAFGAALRVGGAFTDWLNRDLIANQRAAAGEFRNLASGATDLQAAMTGTQISAMSEGLDRMVARMQEGRVGRIWHGFWSGATGGGFTVEQRNVNEVERTRTNMVQRRSQLEILTGNQRLTTLRTEMGIERGILGFRERNISLQERFSRRVLMGVMGGGETFRAGISPQQAVLSIEMNRLRREGIEPTGAALEKLTEAARKNAAAIYQGGLVNAYGDLAENLAQSNREANYTIQTMGLVGDEAAAATQELRMMRIEERIRGAGTDNLTKDQLNNLRNVRKQMGEQLEALRELGRQRASKEVEIADRKQMASLEAQTRHLGVQIQVARGRYQLIVDTTREETKLNELRSRGAADWLLRQAEQELVMRRFYGEQIQLAQLSLRVAQQAAQPFQTYLREVGELDRVLAVGGINQQEYNTRLEAISNTLIQAAAAQQHLNEAMNLGSAAATGSAEMYQRLERQQERLRFRTPQEEARIRLQRRETAVLNARALAQREQVIRQEMGGETPTSLATPESQREQQRLRLEQTRQRTEAAQAIEAHRAAEQESNRRRDELETMEEAQARNQRRANRANERYQQHRTTIGGIEGRMRALREVLRLGTELQQSPGAEEQDRFRRGLRIAGFREDITVEGARQQATAHLESLQGELSNAQREAREAREQFNDAQEAADRMGSRATGARGAFAEAQRREQALRQQAQDSQRVIQVLERIAALLSPQNQPARQPQQNIGIANFFGL